MNEIFLSVLIPTLIERRTKFNTLFTRLKILSHDYPVEILSNEDNREKSTGTKRNELIDMAKGKYSAFIDDDDDVPDHYFDSIFKAIKKNPETDCIGFKGIIIHETNLKLRQKQIVFRHSKGFPYSQNPIRGEYLRPPNHLNPMFTDYFKQIRFPDITYAEDFDFALKLAKADLIKNETYLDIIMYHYYFNPRRIPVNNLPLSDGK